MWICLTILFVVGTLFFFPFGGLIFLIFGGLLGPIFVLPIMRIIKLKAISFDGEIDFDDLSKFLTDNLQNFSGYFYEWEHQPDFNIVMSHFENKKMFACIKLGVRGGKKEYTAYTVYTIKSGLIALFFGMGAFKEYTSVYKATPILNAAMEYYLKNLINIIRSHVPEGRIENAAYFSYP